MKKRSNSQKIGEIGETIFKLYAQKELNLLPNKLEFDYGFDFLCQLQKGKEPSIVYPLFIGVNVKSTENEIISAKLNRDDIKNIIACDFPVLITLVDIKKERVYFRFFDLELLNAFSSFLNTNRKNFIIKKEIMYSDSALFKNMLNTVMRKEYRNYLTILKIKLELHKIIGENKLVVKQTEEGSLAIIEVANLEQLFIDKDKEIRNLFLARDINKASIPIASYKNFVTDELSSIATNVAVVAPIFYDEVELSIIGATRELSKCSFEKRKYHDEISYYHPSGLTLISSQRRLGEDGQYYHFFEITVEEVTSKSIFEYPDIIDFLLNCIENTKIKVSNVKGDGVPTEQWGNLFFYRDIINTILKIYEELNIEKPKYKLYELDDEKTLTNLYFLHNLLFDHENIMLPGFILENQDYLTENTEKLWKGAIITSYLKVYLGEITVCLRVDCNGSVLLKGNNDTIGVQFDTKKNVSIISIEQNTGKIVSFPELILDEHSKILISNNNVEIIRTDQSEKHYTKYTLTI
ncbi:DUF4365 domain-containing protein [Peribacillus simplex]|uniref:DUF4365 domain-containing protein n=1 Tax=Peribacillus simplex TaxID=1478 RepID=UPI00339B2BD0